MRWLCSRWPDVKQQILKSGHTLLFLDYDGTLAPIAPSPEQATLPSSTRSVLQRLSRNPRVTVALVSGLLTPRQPLTLTSRMPDGGVIFGDGMQADYLPFNAGVTAHVGIASTRLQLVMY